MATATSVLTVGAIPVIVDIDETITHRSGGGRGGDRPAHQGGGAGAYVGRGLQHDGDHGHRRTARPHRHRGFLPGRRRLLRGQEVRLDRPCRRVQLQLLQEHDLRRGRRRLGQRRRRSPSRVRCAIDPCHYYWHGRNDAEESVRRQRRARLGARGRDAERPARPARRHGRRDARGEAGRSLPASHRSAISG